MAGAQSGTHAGRLEPYSQGDGASFVPNKPFEAGEQVTVSATIGSAGTSEYSFRVDTPYSTAAVGEFPNPQAPPADYQSFDTLPGVQAPLLTVTVPDRDPAAGDVFTTNGPGPGRYGALIYTPQGRLVWFDQTSGGIAAEDLNVQTYDGQRDLTFWQGQVLSLGFGQGEDVVMNSSYQTVATVKGGNGLQADLHDFQIAAGRHRLHHRRTTRSTATSSSAGGPRDGVILDAAVQEIDMKTGLVRWEWHSLDHVDVDESETSPPPQQRVGLVPHQLDRPRARRQRPHLGAQHLGGLPAPGRDRPDPLAPRRPEQLVRDGPGHQDGLAARRPHPARRRCHVLRRRLRPAGALRGPPVARGTDRARPRDPHGRAWCPR